MTFSLAEHAKNLVAGRKGYVSKRLSTCVSRSHPAGAWCVIKHFGKKIGTDAFRKDFVVREGVSWEREIYFPIQWENKYRGPVLPL